MLGAPNPSTMTCDEIIKGYEKNLLLSTPEGGRSKNHRKQHAKRVKELQTFYDDCVAGKGSADQQAQQLEIQQAVDMVYDTYGQPATMSTAYQQQPTSGIPAWLVLILGVGTALAVVYTVTKKKGSE